jgi:hypothetical protein
MAKLLGLALLAWLAVGCGGGSDASKDVVPGDDTGVGDVFPDAGPYEDTVNLNITSVWADPATGLVWQDPPAEDHMYWVTAKQYCEDVEGDGHSDWRLPTVGELRTLLRGCPATITGGTCNVDDDDCLLTACADATCAGCTEDDLPDSGCFRPAELNGACDWFWSSSADGAGGDAWAVDFLYSTVYSDDGSHAANIRCVHD